MSSNSIAQPTQLVKVSPTTLIVVEDPHVNGVHYVAAIDEWVTVIDGEVTSYHTHQGLAWASYNEQLATYADHIRNEYNAPGLFVAEPITWEACPDCGRVVDLDDNCPDCEFEKLERIQKGRGRRPGHTYDIAPGDGGISDQDIDSGPTPEYRRMLEQEMKRRKRAEALPASVDQTGSIEDMLGYDDDIPFDGRPMPEHVTDDYGLEARF